MMELGARSTRRSHARSPPRASRLCCPPFTARRLSERNSTEDDNADYGDDDYGDAADTEDCGDDDNDNVAATAGDEDEAKKDGDDGAGDGDARPKKRVVHNMCYKGVS